MAPFPKMRVIIPCIGLAVVSFSVLFFYGNSVSHVCTNSSDVSTSPPAEPYVLSMPHGNCNCSVLYTQTFATGSQAATPSLYCQCQGTEVQIVEKEVIKEVVKDVQCPVCTEPESKVVEKEVIKEVEVKKECPPVPGYAEDRNAHSPATTVREGVCTSHPWHAEGKTWHFPAKFPRCSMDACFNFTKCEKATELLIYTYDLPAPPQSFFSRINSSRYFTDDPRKACIFLVFLDADNPWPPHPNTLPHWNNGLNHALVIFADMWSQKGPPQDSIGMAAVLATDIHETTYRAGFDISIPLPGRYHMPALMAVNATRRKYLATFRGLRYLGKTGEGVFRSWDSFREMHNGRDVIVATSCDHPINNMNREKEPALGVHCDEDEAVHRSHDFIDLMNTTFALVPAGIQPASYRFIEVLSAGAIPVLIADNYVKPFDTLIQWYKCLLQFPTTEMQRIVATLRAMTEEEILRRQQYCMAVYDEYLKNDETLLRSSVRALKARFLGAIPNF